MKGIRIRPEQSGLKTSLFDLEAEIMEIVWSEGMFEFSVSTVHRKIDAYRPVAYTTIMTTVSRLFDKGLLHRHKEGRKYVYCPQMSRQEFIEQTTRQVLDSLPEGGHQAAVAYLVDRVAEADDAELDRLEALIHARRQKSKGSGE